jgi:hypothetical protein
MTSARGRGPHLAMIVGVLAVLGCGGTRITPGRTPSDVPTSEAQPSGTFAATAPASTPLPTRRPAGLPPDALLAVEGGDPVVGDLGSFTWLNAGSDSPWLPGEPIRVGAGETLAIELDPPIAIQEWTATRRPWPLPDGVAEAPVDRGSLGEAVSFMAPPPGIWSVHVSVWFASNRGQASYFWRIEIR